MKNRKRRVEPLSFYDYVGISRHLEKMAAKGWMLEKITNLGWVYRRIEPKQLHFTVSYYSKASEFDPEPTEDQKTFYDFCAHTGWQLACTSAQLQIFYNERENPTPIETDAKLEVQAIHASAKKSFIPAYLALLVIALLNGGLFVSGIMGDPIKALSSPYKEAFNIDFDSYATFFSVNRDFDDFLKEMKAQTRELQGVGEKLQQLVAVCQVSADNTDSKSE